MTRDKKAPLPYSLPSNTDYHVVVSESVVRAAAGFTAQANRSAAMKGRPSGRSARLLQASARRSRPYSSGNSAQQRSPPANREREAPKYITRDKALHHHISDGFVGDNPLPVGAAADAE